MNGRQTSGAPKLNESGVLSGGISRRGFLLGAGSLAVLSACGSSGESSSATSTTLHTARLSGDPFGLGIASGDPDPSSVILWTRLAPDPLAVDGAGGMPNDKVDVRWQIATDGRFREVVGAGVATADPDQGHSLHVEAGDLEPASDYHYRFTVGEWTSPVGRTRTLPAADASVDRIRLAIANCQYFESGLYGAYRHMIDDDIDLVVHLGDYIYELPALGGQRQSAPRNPPTTLDEYRLRYASYKVDRDLRAAHAALPFTFTWDDHEVADNYMGDTLPSDEPAADVSALRTAAYRAWWENLPVRLPPPDGPDVAVYHDVTFGDLARLYILDERQYADVPPCRDANLAAYDVGTCAEVGDDRDRLGADQEAWLDDSMGQGGVTWNLLGSPVALAGVDSGTGDEPQYFLDLWDGYPVARERVIALLAESDNPVVLSGDYHAGMVLDVNRRPFDVDSELVAPEFLSPAISSVLFDADVSERTPQLRQQINAHGYLTVEVRPEHLTAEFRILDDVQRADTAIHTEATWRVDAGDPTPRPV